MSERPKIPVVRRRPSADSPKEGPDPSGTKTIPTPARGLDRAILERYVQAPDRPADPPRTSPRRGFFTPNAIPAPREANPRSEEHTSELQSHHELVCRLLPEKKKQQKKKNTD